MDIMITEVIENDLKTLLRINSMVLQAARAGINLVDGLSGRVYQYFDFTYLEPPYKLNAPTDFSQGFIQENLKLGYTSLDTAMRSK